jgi:hypothetical protein
MDIDRVVREAEDSGINTTKEWMRHVILETMSEIGDEDKMSAASSMNWTKTTEKKPVWLREKLVELKLMHLLPSSMPQGGWAAPARKILFESKEFRSRKIAAEKIAEQHNAEYQLGPCAMPCLNPKESFYRWLKMRLSEFNGVSMDELRNHVQTLVSSYDVPARAERWFFFDNLQRGVVGGLSEDQMMANGTVTGGAIEVAVRAC